VAELTAWVADVASARRVWSLVAAGGTGKTAVVEQVVRDLRLDDGNVLVWSFYENPDADAFLRECNHLFLGEEETTASGRLERLERGLSNGCPHLIVLDGLERVQDEAGGGRVRGELSDHSIKLLLRALASRLGRARALVTSRFPLVDLEDWKGKGYDVTHLDHLTPAAAVDVLRSWGVVGDDALLRDAAEKVGHHALSVAVIGSYLRSFASGRVEDVANFDLEAVTGDDPKAAKLARVLAYYANRLPPEERDLLSRLSVFPGAVTWDDLNALVDAGSEVAGSLTRARLGRLLETLEVRGLLSKSEAHVVWMAHPFLREAFQSLLGCRPERVFDVVARRLRANLETMPGKNPTRPHVLDHYERLIVATRLAGREDEAFNLYVAGMGGYQHLGVTLGEYTRGYRILSGFSKTGRSEGLGLTLHVEDRLHLAKDLALYALKVGRTAEGWAVQRGSDEWARSYGDPARASEGLVNSAELALARGNVVEAYALAKLALGEARVTKDSVLVRNALSAHASAAHGIGDIETARSDFAEATTLATTLESSELYSMSGVQHARHQLDTGDTSRASSLCQHGLKVARGNHWTEEIAWFEALLARIELASSRRAGDHLRQVRAWTARTGDMQYVVEGHLLAALEFLARGDLQAGLLEVEVGLRKAVSCGFGILHMELLIALSRIRLAWLNASRAIEAAREALDLAADPEHQYAWGEADASQALGEAYFANHEPTPAKTAFARALALRRRLSHPGLADTERWLEQVC
jgi:hypothetical protein